MTTFFKSEAWEYHLDITKLDRPYGTHSLTISSRFPGAKNPEEHITQFQCILDLTDLRAIRNHIDTHLGTRP